MTMTDTTTWSPEGGPAPQEGTAESRQTEPANVPDPMEVLAREAADYKDRLLRALAEMENMRRRTEREVADARSYAISSFARDLLAVADNMRRALDAVGAEDRRNADAGVKALIDGIELTERELLNALERNGVKKLEPEGTKFDPHRHQAMYELPDPSVPAGTVVQVVQPGYTIGERVLRPALVAVAKGGPKASASNETPEEAAAPDNDNSAVAD